MTAPFSHDPTRLIESVAHDHAGLRDLARLRQDLEIARAARLDYSVDAGLARFEASIAGATTLPSGGTVAGFAVLRWFLGVSAVVGVSVGVVAWLLTSSQPEFRSEDGKVAEIVSTTPAGVGDASSVADIEPESAGLRPAPESSLDVGVRESVVEPQQPGGDGKIGAALSSVGGEPADQLAAAPRPTSKSWTAPAEPEPAVEPAVEEAKLIDAARKALTDDPARTLELTEQVAERFPAGAMIQERRGYAILALLALDRRAEAEDQASEYLERWPKGPLSRRIRDGLGLLP